MGTPAHRKCTALIVGCCCSLVSILFHFELPAVARFTGVCQLYSGGQPPPSVACGRIGRIHRKANASRFLLDAGSTPFSRGALFSRCKRGSTIPFPRRPGDQILFITLSLSNVGLVQEEPKSCNFTETRAHCPPSRGFRGCRPNCRGDRLRNFGCMGLEYAFVLLGALCAISLRKSRFATDIWTTDDAEHAAEASMVTNSSRVVDGKEDGFGYW